jgi:hypothetical protein
VSTSPLLKGVSMGGNTPLGKVIGGILLRAG